MSRDDMGFRLVKPEPENGRDLSASALDDTTAPRPDSSASLAVGSRIARLEAQMGSVEARTSAPMLAIYIFSGVVVGTVISVGMFLAYYHFFLAT